MEAHMRKLAAFLASWAVLAAAVPVVSAASPPAPQHEQISFTLGGMVQDCGSFQIVTPEGGDVSRNMLTWYDDAGNVTRERFNIHYSIPIYNSVTGLEGVYKGQFVINYDAATQVFQRYGSGNNLFIEGRNVLHVAGHTAVDESVGEVLFEHGNLDAAADWFGQWCALMDRSPR
jgi:hypothetical protein